MDNSSPNGCGLGLAIVKEIAHIHQATLKFATGQNNKGLSVEITFPETNQTTKEELYVNTLR